MCFFAAIWGASYGDGEDERAGELEEFEVDPDFDEIDLGEVRRELPAFEPRSRDDDEDNG